MDMGMRLMLTGVSAIFLVWPFGRLAAADAAPEDAEPAKTEKSAKNGKTEKAGKAERPPMRVAEPEAPIVNPGSSRDLRAIRMKVLLLLRPGNRIAPSPAQLEAFRKSCDGKLGDVCGEIAVEIVKLGNALARGAKEPAPDELPPECYVAVECPVCRNEGTVRCKDCAGRGFTYKKSTGDKPAKIDCKTCNKTGRVPCPEKCDPEKPVRKFSRGAASTAYEARLLRLNRILLNGR